MFFYAVVNFEFWILKEIIPVTFILFIKTDYKGTWLFKFGQFNFRQLKFLKKVKSATIKKVMYICQV